MISSMSIRDPTEREVHATISHIEEVDPSFAREIRRAREGKRLPWVERPKDKGNGDFLINVNDAVRLYVELHPLRTDADARRLKVIPSAIAWDGITFLLKVEKKKECVVVKEEN